MKSQLKNFTSLIKAKVSELDPDAEVILYGSRARGEEKGESDWDILILTHEHMSIEKETAFRNHLYDLELETGEAISVIAFSKKDWNTRQRITPFYTNVSQEGITL